MTYTPDAADLLFGAILENDYIESMASTVSSCSNTGQSGANYSNARLRKLFIRLWRAGREGPRDDELQDLVEEQYRVEEGIFHQGWRAHF